MNPLDMTERCKESMLNRYLDPVPFCANCYETEGLKQINGLFFCEGCIEGSKQDLANDFSKAAEKYVIFSDVDGALITGLIGKLVKNLVKEIEAC